MNSIIEQDHRFIKKITKPMMGFKAFNAAQAKLRGNSSSTDDTEITVSEAKVSTYKQF